MSPEYSLCPQSTVYVPREYESTVYVPRVQFMTTEYDIFPQIYVSSKVQFMALDCLYAQIVRVQFRAQFVPREQFISLEYSLCPQCTVYVLRAQLMFPKYSLSP